MKILDAAHRMLRYSLSSYASAEQKQQFEDIKALATHVLSEFPVQKEWNRNGRWGIAPETRIPMWLAEVAYEEYAKRYGRQQTLARIGERGGFGREELLDLLRGAKR